MKKLTLQQLAVYLPYDLSVEITNNPLKGEIHKLSGILYNGLANLGEGGMFGFLQRKFDSFKPILYPISCLTKPITHNNETFVPILKLAEISFNSRKFFLHREWALDNSHSVVFSFSEDSFVSNHNGTGEDIEVKNQYKLFQKLAEWHINFLNIPEGLFIDKSTLK